MVCQDGQKKLLLRLVIGDAKAVVKEVEIPAGQETVSLHIVSDPAVYTFYGDVGDGEVEMGSARTQYLSSEVAGGFTGVVMAMYAVNESDSENWAEFTNLIWTQSEA